jgi:hypothetical protein
MAQHPRRHNSSLPVPEALIFCFTIWISHI